MIGAAQSEVGCRVPPSPADHVCRGSGSDLIMFTAKQFHAKAAESAEQDFVNRSKGGVPDEIPEVQLSGAPLGLAQLLKQAGLAPSSSEASRLIEGGGVRIDSSVVSDKALKLEAGTYVVQVGKRKFARVRLS